MAIFDVADNYAADGFVKQIIEEYAPHLIMLVE